jgi:hypothetical protein
MARGRMEERAGGVRLGMSSSLELSRNAEEIEAEQEERRNVHPMEDLLNAVLCSLIPPPPLRDLLSLVVPLLSPKHFLPLLLDPRQIAQLDRDQLVRLVHAELVWGLVGLDDFASMGEDEGWGKGLGLGGRGGGRGGSWGQGDCWWWVRGG